MKVVRILIVCLMLASCNQGEHEIVVVPKNYIGRIMIVYDQTNGIEPIYKDGKRVYEIPLSGVLKTKASPNPGWVASQSFIMTRYHQRIV